MAELAPAGETTYPCQKKKCLELLFNIFQNVSTTMWLTTDTKRSASLFIQKKIVNTKTVAQENAQNSTEKDAD